MHGKALHIYVRTILQLTTYTSIFDYNQHQWCAIRACLRTYC